MKNPKTALVKWLEEVWYDRQRPPLVLIPLSWIYRLTIVIRSACYAWGLLPVDRVPVPVIVIGNLTVGGTGKTPLTVWVVQRLVRSGFNPGIVSRGYGGKARQWPQPVFPDSDYRVVGDEALIVSKRTGCPMAVAANRVAAVKYLLQNHHCDIIISDDGIQHYALSRDIEIAVIDSQRRFGNGYCLPAGPLREPLSRLQTVALTIVNGQANANETSMQMHGQLAVNMEDESVKKKLSDFNGQKFHAIAGIGNPNRFFGHLSEIGLNFDKRQFPDHHVYNGTDIHYNDTLPIVMTEKDAVKCQAFMDKRYWYVPVEAVVDEKFENDLMTLLAEKTNGRKVT